MELLFESKRMWLISYTICTVIPITLYYFLWEYPIARTIGVMCFVTQSIILVFFLLIVIFKWTLGCRTIAFILYLGITIYLGVTGMLVKWYIIIPIFLATDVYMLWNLGGVANCIIAGPYRKRLNEKINTGRGSYGSYAGDIGEYNDRNKLGFFTKVRKKREPKWNELGFDSGALQMFNFWDAVLGISSQQWDNKEKKLDRINSRLNDKNSALYNNRSIHEEKACLHRISGKAGEAGLDTTGYDKSGRTLEKVRKKNVKKEKKVLRKRL